MSAELLSPCYVESSSTLEFPEKTACQEFPWLILSQDFLYEAGEVPVQLVPGLFHYTSLGVINWFRFRSQPSERYANSRQAVRCFWTSGIIEKEQSVTMCVCISFFKLLPVVPLEAE